MRAAGSLRLSVAAAMPLYRLRLSSLKGFSCAHRVLQGEAFASNATNASYQNPVSSPLSPQRESACKPLEGLTMN